VRSLWVVCDLCHHKAVLNVDRFGDDIPVPAFDPRMVCTSCGIVGAFARPNWQERPSQESLTGGPRFTWRRFARRGRLAAPSQMVGSLHSYSRVSLAMVSPPG
jgi:hypothetical protein